MSVDRPLPVPIEPFDDESGAGFCLRLAERNRISMVQLRGLLGLPPEKAIRREHVTRLAMLCDVDPAILVEKFPDAQRLARSGMYFWGHSLRLPSYVRWTRPQMCPLCLGQRVICLGEWDLTFSCVCLKHSCLLFDSCPTCAAPLRWERPATEWCDGHHFLGVLPRQADPVSPELIEMQSILHAFMCRMDPHGQSFDWPFGHGVTLNGWLSLIDAFGSVSKPHCQPHRGTFCTIPSAATVRSISARAYERMKAFSRRGGNEDESLKSLIAEAPLVRLLRDSDEVGDRTAAMDVYRFAAGDKALESVLRRSRRGHQLSLFD